MVTGTEIRDARKTKNLSQEALGDLVGISKQAISQIEKGIIQPKDETLNKIVNSLDIKLTKTLPPNAVNGFALTDLQELDDESPFIDLGNGQYIMVVPWIQENAYAGYQRGFKDAEYLKEMPTKSMVVNKQHRGRYVAITVIGDSMFDGTIESIPEGSIAFGREIQKHLWTSRFHIHKFKDYIINHREGLLVKRIVKHDVEKGIITCHSLNPNKEEYEDFELHLDDCDQIFNIVDVTLKR